MNNAKKEENNTMGKTRDLSKKIRGNKGTFHAKMGSIRAGLEAVDQMYSSICDQWL